MLVNSSPRHAFQPPVPCDLFPVPCRLFPVLPLVTRHASLVTALMPAVPPARRRLSQLAACPGRPWVPARRRCQKRSLDLSRGRAQAICVFPPESGAFWAQVRMLQWTQFIRVVHLSANSSVPAFIDVLSCCLQNVQQPHHGQRVLLAISQQGVLKPPPLLAFGVSPDHLHPGKASFTAFGDFHPFVSHVRSKSRQHQLQRMGPAEFWVIHLGQAP